MGLDDSIRVKNLLIRATIAEFIGTLILVFAGHSVGVAHSTVSMSRKADPAAILMGSTFGGSLVLFVALTGTILISGGHLNPSITVGAAATGQFPLAYVAPYLASQYLAGFIAACLLYLTHYDFIDIVLESHSNNTILGYGRTAHIFASAPAPHATNFGCFIQTFFASVIFLMGLSAITDTNNLGAPKWFYPLGYSLSLLVVSVAFAGNGGPSINPAADFPCRIFAWMAGWDEIIWEPLNGHYWYLTGLIAPHLGAFMGLFLYKVLIGSHFPPETPLSKSPASRVTQTPTSTATPELTPIPSSVPIQDTSAPKGENLNILM